MQEREQARLGRQPTRGTQGWRRRGMEQTRHEQGQARHGAGAGEAEAVADEAK